MGGNMMGNNMGGNNMGGNNNMGNNNMGGNMMGNTGTASPFKLGGATGGATSMFGGGAATGGTTSMFGGGAATGGATSMFGGGAMGGGGMMGGGGAMGGMMNMQNNNGNNNMMNRTGGKVVYDLHHKTFDTLQKEALSPQMVGLVNRMLDTYEMVKDAEHTSHNLDECWLELQLSHLQEVKGNIHRVKLNIEDVENIKIKQLHLLDGNKNGLKHVAKVLSRDQRYASQAVRDLKQNLSQHIAPTDYFDRLYANLCEQMTGKTLPGCCSCGGGCGCCCACVASCVCAIFCCSDWVLSCSCSLSGSLLQRFATSIVRSGERRKPRGLPCRGGSRPQPTSAAQSMGATQPNGAQWDGRRRGHGRWRERQ